MFPLPTPSSFILFYFILFYFILFYFFLLKMKVIDKNDLDAYTNEEILQEEGEEEGEKVTKHRTAK